MSSGDVKIKFGGDFSGVSKGAEEAGKKAGGSFGAKLNEQLSEFGTSMAAKIGGMFAVDAIFETLKEKFLEAKEYFSNLNAAIRTTGSGGYEFQRVAYLAKSVGVSMEVVGKSLGLFSKYMGLASKDSKGHGKVLRELGFTTEEIESGTITATQALAALAKQLRETGDENIAAANASIIFGRSGRELLPIIKKGDSAIKEQAAGLKLYSEAELQAAEAAERAAERRAAAWKKFFRFLSLELDKNITKSVVMDTSLATTQEFQSKGINVTSDEGRAKLNAEVIKRLQAKGVGLEAQKEAFKKIEQELAGSVGATPQLRSELAVELAEMMKSIESVQQESEKRKPGVDASGVAALSSSSLQAIGGGDISSILSGTYQDSMLDAAVRTADNTQRIAEKQPDNRPTLTITK